MPVRTLIWAVQRAHHLALLIAMSCMQTLVRKVGMMRVRIFTIALLPMNWIAPLGELFLQMMAEHIQD